jgi:hypothetical protein
MYLGRLKLCIIGLFLSGPAFSRQAPIFLAVGTMPPRIARYRRSGLLRRVFLSAFAWSAAPLAGQELLLQRDYPGSGPYECPTLVTLVAPTPDEQARAGQLASDANQAMILGDFERVAALLAQATELCTRAASPAAAYRSAGDKTSAGSLVTATETTTASRAPWVAALVLAA